MILRLRGSKGGVFDGVMLSTLARLKCRQFCISLMLALVAITGCGQPDLLRYDNRATCLGAFHSGNGRYFQGGYRTPIRPESADMSLSWHQSSRSILLKDWEGIMHLIHETGGGAVEQVNNLPPRRNSGPTVSEAHYLIALPIGIAQSAAVYVYSFPEEKPADPVATISRLESPKWHPDALLLAGIYYPEGYEHGSNVVGLFNVERFEPVLVSTHELEYSNIREVFGWSSNGEVIAVSQYSENGAIPYYLYVEEQMVERSLFDTASHNCVIDARWAPDEQVIAFSGDNDLLDGWDIFLETVASVGSEDRFLTNLTNTPGADEYNVAWSPDGSTIAYTKAYYDSARNLRQELYLINLDDDSSLPVQLTDTLEEFETNPIWIAEDRIAYLSWHPAEAIWTLKAQSIDGTVSEPETVLEIPREWYYHPHLGQ